MIRSLVVVGLVSVGLTVLADPPMPAGDCKLVYYPKPPYPVALRRAYFPIQGEGTFSVVFGFDGKVSGVKVARSTGNDALDDAAIATLRHWKSAPGRSCSVSVPVKFHPGAGAGF
jgi:periplasmic protein TonB